MWEIEYLDGQLILTNEAIILLMEFFALEYLYFLMTWITDLELYSCMSCCLLYCRAYWAGSYVLAQKQIIIGHYESFPVVY